MARQKSLADLQNLEEERSFSGSSGSVTSGICSWPEQRPDCTIVSSNNCDCTYGESSAACILTEEEAWKIAPDIGSNYRDVARELKISEAEISEIDHDKNGRNSNKEKALAVLHKFMQTQGRAATKYCLAFALDKAGRRDIAEKLIGDPDFLQKKKGQVTFILKEQAHIHIDEVWICEDKDGCIYRLAKLVGSELETYEKFKESQEQRGSMIVDMDKTHSDFADMFLNFESKNNQKRVEEQLSSCNKILEEFQKSLEGQEDKTNVALQLDGYERQVLMLQSLASCLVRQADDIPARYHSYTLRCQIYDASNFLSDVGKKLEERVNSLLGMTTSDEELQLRVNKLLESCLSLRNAMQEKIFLGSLRDLMPQAKERRHQLSSSTSIPPKAKVDESSEKRHNTFPNSDREKKEMAERIRPPRDPLGECDDDVWTTKN